MHRSAQPSPLHAWMTRVSMSIAWLTVYRRTDGKKSPNNCSNPPPTTVLYMLQKHAQMLFNSALISNQAESRSLHKSILCIVEHFVHSPNGGTLGSTRALHIMHTTYTDQAMEQLQFGHWSSVIVQSSSSSSSSSSGIFTSPKSSILITLDPSLTITRCFLPANS